jgi:hypothetical protein
VNASQTLHCYMHRTKHSGSAICERNREWFRVFEINRSEPSRSMDPRFDIDRRSRFEIWSIDRQKLGFFRPEEW